MSNDTLGDVEGFAQRLIRRKARQLCRRPGFSRDEVHDLQQAMFLEIWRKRKQFDPHKGRWTTYLFRLLDHWISNEIEARSAAIRDFRRRQHLHGSEPEAARMAGGPRQAGAGRDLQLVDLRLDLERAQQALPDRLRQRCQALLSQSASAIARERRIPKQAVLEDVQQLRSHFDDLGFREYAQ